MSRKTKTLRAFLHQNQNPTIEQAWDTAWKRAQKSFHARSMQDMEAKLAAAQAEIPKLTTNLNAIVAVLDLARLKALGEFNRTGSAYCEGRTDAYQQAIEIIEEWMK